MPIDLDHRAAEPGGAVPDPLKDGIATLALRLRAREITAVALTEACLARIAVLEPQFRAFVTLCAETALRQAEAADQRLAAGGAAAQNPLLGIPIGLKDMFDIKGVPMTAGMPSRANAIATADSEVTTRLHAAGAVILGTLKLAEGVFGEYRPKDQAPVNPWGPDLWPGASSGGSAVAVATRLCAASVASDTGGSVRMPSAVNGQTGLKSTKGRISLVGAFPLAPSFDHGGVIAPTARDAAALFRAIAGPAPASAQASTSQQRRAAQASSRRGMSATPRRLRIGLAGDWLRGCNADVVAALDRATAQLGDLGHSLVPVELPASEEIAADWYTVASVELAAVHDITYNLQPESYGQALATAIRVGRGQDLEALQAARARLDSFAADLRGALSRVDVLALPVFPFPPPSWADMARMDEPTILALHRYTCPFSVSGLPTITLPAGLNAAGHPLAVQFAGPAWSEELLLELAAEFQAVTAWHLAVPPALRAS